MRRRIAISTYVIVGGGLAGVSAAEALRGAGYDGRIVLVGKESEYPYQRPPLSKELLRGEVPNDFAYLRTTEFYAANAIEVHLGDAVASIEPADRRVECASGVRFDYDKLLIATGGSPRRLRLPGSELPGVLYLRSLADSLALRAKLRQHPDVLVIGGGFIGCEVAASAKQLGCGVAIAGPTLPMAHALGTRVGEIYTDFHRGQGVTVRTGVTVTAFRGAGKVEEAVFSDGSTIACTTAVVGIGIDPSVDILKGVDTSDGLATDEFCRTAVDNVFAAGDIARAWRPRLGRHVRLEHFDNAQLQGSAAAQSMCGNLVPHDPIAFFWSDQYAWDLQYYGHATTWDEVVLRGRPADGSFIAFYVKDGRIDAVCAVNASQDVMQAKRLLGRHDIARKQLADSNAPLKSFAN